MSSIGDSAFSSCPLTSVTLPSSIANLGEAAFTYSDPRAVYFQGNAPGNPGIYGAPVFDQDNATAYNATAYYLPGTTGWGPAFGGIPTAPWTLPYPLILGAGPGFGVRSNQFGFTVSWATNLAVVVEASTNLLHPVWEPPQTNTLTSGWFYFSDPRWTSFARRFCRIRCP